MKRSILIKHNNDKKDIKLVLNKAEIVNSSGNNFIYIEEMNDGNWRLVATKDIIDDFRDIDCLKFHREN